MAERQRQGIVISGVDIASPDHSVADGKCEQLHNMRYADGAWRNVHSFIVKHNLMTNPNYAFNIIYQHPATKENQYIAEYNYTEPITLFYGFKMENGSVQHFKHEIISIGDYILNINTEGVETVGIITEVTYSGEEVKTKVKLLLEGLEGEEIEVSLWRVPGADVEEDKTFHYISLVEVVNEDVELVQNIHKFDEGSQLSISHFGKVLLVSDKTNKKLEYFILKGGEYKRVDWDEISCKSTISVGTDLISPEAYALNNAGIAYPDFEGAVVCERICNKDYTEFYFVDYLEKEDVWRGELALFCALRDESGAILYTSSPQILRSTLLAENVGRVPDRFKVGQLWYGDISGGVHEDGDIYAICGHNEPSESPEQEKTILAASYHRFVAPTLKLDYSIGASQTISNIAIYATRLHSLIDRSIITDNVYDLHNSVDLLQEPFYLMDVINIDPKKVSGTLSYQIGYSKLKNIEQKSLYIPSINPKLLYSENFSEYNNRLHLIAPEERLSSLESSNIIEGTAGTDYLAVQWGNNNGKTIYSSPSKKYNIEQGFLVTFPQNVETLYWVNKYNDSYEAFGQLELKYNAAIDISYYINKITLPVSAQNTNEQIAKYIFYKYNLITNVSIPNEYQMDISSVLTIPNSNRIQVSEANNCFSYPYTNSYRIGSETSHIIAANSAAVEMSDAKFGEFPLYVFTDEGVFAMQSSAGAVYSAVIPISYDKIIQPNTLAVNYNVLFVTKEGIMALSSQGIKPISQELDNLNGNLPEWMKTTKLMHLPRFNEIVATDLENNLLYVYSANQQVWSTRDIKSGRILNNGEIVVDNNVIYDLLNEDDSTTNTEVTLLTRPIKLGTMELKRLETFILRFEASSAQTLRVQLQGLTDTGNWINFREVSVYTNRDILIRRVPLSAKYLRVKVVGEVTDDIRVIAMEMEYYLRLLHRMR